MKIKLILISDVYGYFVLIDYSCCDNIVLFSFSCVVIVIY